MPPPATGAPALATRAAPLVFDHVTVIDVRTGRRLPAQRVVVVGRRIRAVGPVHSVRVPRAAQVVDARGKYLIPGLWDMEAYVYGTPEPLLGLLVANGVTGYRNLSEAVSMRAEGGRYRVTIDSMLTWRRAITSGAWVGPRILIGGRKLEGCALQLADSLTDSPLCTDQSGATSAVEPEEIGVRTPARARALVDSLHAAGADHIFVYNNLVMRREIVFAILAAARRWHLPVVGHLQPGVTLAEASDSGWHQVDHLMGTEGSCVPHAGEGADSLKDVPSLAKCTALAQRLRRNGTWLAVGPLYSLYPRRMTKQEIERRIQYWPQQLRPNGLDAVNRPGWNSDLAPQNYFTLIERAGLPLLFGTDLGAGGWQPIGFQLHNDMATVVEHGLSPLTALQAATLNAARYLGGTDSLGTVEAGKLADLVLLDADPLADIYHTQQIRAVVADGRYYDRAALDRLLAQSGAAEWR